MRVIIKIKAVFIHVLYWAREPKVDFSDLSDEGIVQYYDKWVGFKGIFKPPIAPIARAQKVISANQKGG
jgi:hypothetical protein